MTPDKKNELARLLCDRASDLAQSAATAGAAQRAASDGGDVERAGKLTLVIDALVTGNFQKAMDDADSAGFVMPSLPKLIDTKYKLEKLLREIAAA